MSRRTSSTGKGTVDLRRGRETGIETLQARFLGHAYDPHSHNELLVGVTRQGIQRFACRRTLHTSMPGHCILIEPGEVHDGHGPTEDGFDYAMLYLPVAWFADQLIALGQDPASALGFRHTLVDDERLARAVTSAFLTTHGSEGRLARDEALDRLVVQLAGRVETGVRRTQGRAAPPAVRARELLEVRMSENLSLTEIAAGAGTDRFRLSRLFVEGYGQSPHRYLVGLRLRAARSLLASGSRPAAVAAEVGFADQSHLGRWFRRAYGVTPAVYRALCTDVPDKRQAPMQSLSEGGQSACSIPKLR